MEIRDIALVITSLGTLIAIIAPIVDKYLSSSREHRRNVGAELKALLCDCLRTIDEEAENQAVVYRDLLRVKEGNLSGEQFEKFVWSRKVESQALVIVSIFASEDIDARDFQSQLHEYLALSRQKLAPGDSLEADLSKARAKLAASAAKLFSEIKKKHGA
ncbi:hypothetical protein [Roseovarius sp. SYSU LYC5161]|uniref:hypothetical protein n=1 Tax=Roseovarius halophilus (ex Wu et al. 2025) TaxID=3376060 RepID=UPI00399B5BD4